MHRSAPLLPGESQVDFDEWYGIDSPDHWFVRSEWLRPNEVTEEGDLLYPRNETDERYQSLVVKLRDRSQELVNPIWSAFENVATALTSPHYLPLAKEAVQVLGEMVDDAQERVDWLSRKIWQCGHCGDILRPDQAGRHIRKMHKS